MALTVTTLSGPTSVGNRFETRSEATCDNSYASGGEPLTPAELGLSEVDASNCDVVAGSESSTLRPTNAFYKEEKLHLIDSATGKEMEATKDMSKVKVIVTAFGKTRAR
jgi:hypothetical protein